MAVEDSLITYYLLSSKINSGVSAVKQIISGTADFVSSDVTSGKTITFPNDATIDPDKSIVLINSSLTAVQWVNPSQGNYKTVESYLLSKTATTITISANYSQSGGTREYGSCSYQVIEFY